MTVVTNSSVSNALRSFVEEPDRLLDALLELSEQKQVLLCDNCEHDFFERMFELLSKIRNAIRDHYSTELLETFLRISENVENDGVLHIRALLETLKKNT
jgi:hypothetical protein